MPNFVMDPDKSKPKPRTGTQLLASTAGMGSRFDAASGKWVSAPRTAQQVGAGTSSYQSPDQIAASLVTGHTVAGSREDPQFLGWAQKLQQAGGLVGLQNQGQGQVPTAGVGSVMGGNNGGGGRGGRGGGGGGGGISSAKAKQLADQLYAYNSTANDALRSQTNAYDPNLGGMLAGTQNNLRGIEDERNNRLNAFMQNMAGVAGGIAQSNSGAMQNALRDLARQNINVEPMVQSQIQAQGNATAGLANQTGYLAALQGLGQQGFAQNMSTAALTNQGAQSNLANNRQLLLNQIGQQEQQQRQQLEQQKREFLLKYGVSG